MCMQNLPGQPPKPRSEIIRPALTRLAPLTASRRFMRWLLTRLARLLAWLFTRTSVSGRENMVRVGPIIAVANHLGDADLVIGIAESPIPVETMAKVELYDLPVVGWLLNAYGVIWVHRGQPDRRALRAALEGLEAGRIISLAPEGRESVTGSLEEGSGGAAYLALKSGAPILPVTFTGTENARIYGNMKRLRRTPVTMKVGAPFHLEDLPDRKEAIRLGTQQIMQMLAAQLPPNIRGFMQMRQLKLTEKVSKPDSGAMVVLSTI